MMTATSAWTDHLRRRDSRRHLGTSDFKMYKHPSEPPVGLIAIAVATNVLTNHLELARGGRNGEGAAEGVGQIGAERGEREEGGGEHGEEVAQL